MKKITVLFNPSSKGGASGKRKTDIQRKLTGAGIEHRLYESDSEGHLRMLAGEHGLSSDALLAAGGDTTFSIIAQELVRIHKETGRSPVLGMIGTGSANDIPRGLGIEKLSTLIHSVSRWNIGKMDVGEITFQEESRIFLGTVSTGIGVTVNRYLASWARDHRILRKMKVLHPVFSGMAGIRHAFREKLVPRKVHLTWDGGEGEFDFSLLSFLNIPYYAGGMRLAPRASPVSGILDCCIVQTGSFGSSLLTGLRIILLPSGNHPEIKRISSPWFKVSFSSEGDIQYDGEPVYGIGSMEVSVRRKYLDVFLPTGS